MDKKTQLAIFGANRAYDQFSTGQKSLSLEEIIKSIESLDPSEDQIYLEWLISHYLVGGFSLSDIEGIRQDMIFYNDHRDDLRALDVTPERYTVSGFRETLANYKNNHNLKENIIQKRFLENTDIIIDNVSGISLYFYKTNSAQDYLFQGTEWTSDTSCNTSNIFKYYVLMVGDNKFLIQNSFYITRHSTIEDVFKCNIYDKSHR